MNVLYLRNEKIFIGILKKEMIFGKKKKHEITSYNIFGVKIFYKNYNNIIIFEENNYILTLDFLIKSEMVDYYIGELFRKLRMLFFINFYV